MKDLRSITGTGSLRLRLVIVLFGSLLIGAPCAPLRPVVVEPLPQAIQYLRDVKPILDRRCVVCHSCYNAPCQLKLSAYEGIRRGGSKKSVYSSTRLTPQAPTRLFFDAQTVDGWRALDFHNVVQSRAESPANDAIMLLMLEAKKREPKPRGEYRPEASDLTCAASSREASFFLARHPQRGMPFGFPALPEHEHAVLATWLLRGAPGPLPGEQGALTTPNAEDAAEIEKWEAFLNRDDAKHAMTARYLYEHLFLAHLRLAESDSGAYYEMVRSHTPPGEPISVIATLRPYDDPGVEIFFYRLRKIHSTIVHKTHMVVELDDETLSRYRELFIETEWLEEPRRVAYSEVVDPNPFLVFAQIPPRSRYAFLLDHSEFIVRTFMQGPVCRGQVALNVIHDHFWVFFMDPDADQAVLHPEFLIEQAGNLRLPTEAGSAEKIVDTFSNAYRERYAAFYRAKMRLYDEKTPDGQGIEAIWTGRRAKDAPMLTVYRHFDSASLHRGALGRLPRTLWVIDYAQLERLYYALVAGFDVFGNVAHQVNVRRYMDYLRMEGELNFVQFLPPEARMPMFRSWYIGDGAVEDTRGEEILSDRGTKIRYETDDPKRELVERVVAEHLLASTGIDFDPINYRPTGFVPSMPKALQTHKDVREGMRALTVPGTGFIRHVTSSEANVLWVRVRHDEGTDRFVSIVINRWHDNVNSLFFEKARLDPTKDTIDFHEGAIGSYPNYFLDVAAEEIPDFFDMLENFDASPEYVAKFNHYGVNRADDRFWETYDWFQSEAARIEPVQEGLYDLNRYYSKAIE